MAPHLGPGTCTLFCGAFLMPTLANAYADLFRHVRAEGGTIALDTGWPPDDWSDASRAALMDWAPQIDHLLLSEGEIAHLTGIDDLDEAAASVRTRMRSDALLVVKQGAAGATAWTGSASHAWPAPSLRSEEHTSELQSLMRISYAVFCLKKNK